MLVVKKTLFYSVTSCISARIRTLPVAAAVSQTTLFKRHLRNMSVVSEGCLFALGNPLLDISAEVTKDFLDKYGLKANNAILAGDEHQPMYQEMIDKFDYQFIPGGATLNSIRYIQWLLGEQQNKACTFVGCVGKDDYAKTLRELCESDGVNVQFYSTDKEPTGTCAVCITGHDRSLVANLAAANLYSKEDHLTTDAIWSLVKKAKIFYSAGFPLTVCPDGMLALAEHASQSDKIYCTNLSAEFICQFFQEPMSKLLPYTDYLFGNETEAVRFAEANNGPTSQDLKEIAKWASLLPKANKTRSRHIIFTQGLDPILVAKDGQIVLESPVVKLDASMVVDTNSAGDSFVGGFIAALAQGLSLEQCVALGQSAAKYCIQKPGSTFNVSDRAQILNVLS